MVAASKLWWARLSGWGQLIAVIAAVRLVGGLLHVFAPVTMPHMWRQVDTMGVALRYAQRFSVESTELSWWFPAVLNSGDSDGVMAMEFPLLNGLGSLGFVLAGEHIDLGRSLAQLLALILVWVLGYLNWKAWSNVANAPHGLLDVTWAAFLCSFATPFVSKFMPDVAAMLFCFLGTAGIWRFKAWGIVALALGLLMKPTAGVVAAILLLHPAAWNAWRRQLVFVSAALLGPVYWYLHTVPFLKSLEVGPSLFEMHQNFQPLRQLALFWGSFEIWDVLHFHSWFAFGWIPILLGLLILRRDVSLWKLCGLFFLQASLIAALSGDHAKYHAYYLVGLAPVAMLIAWRLWQECNSRVLRTVLAIGLLSRAGEGFMADAGGLWDKRQGSAWFAECEALRRAAADAPWRQGKVWRTPVEEYPLIELCFGERGRSTRAAWGVYRVGQTLPAGCDERAKTDRLILFECPNESSE